MQTLRVFGIPESVAVTKTNGRFVVNLWEALGFSMPLLHWHYAGVEGAFFVSLIGGERLYGWKKDAPTDRGSPMGAKLGSAKGRTPR